QFAMDLFAAGATLLVAEIGNGRVSVFDSAGAFQHTLRTPIPPARVASVDGLVFTGPSVDGYYTSRVGRAGGHARIPGAVTRLWVSDPRTYPPAEAHLAGQDG